MCNSHLNVKGKVIPEISLQTGDEYEYLGKLTHK